MVIAAAADPGLYRLTPEAGTRLRADLTGQLRGLLRPADRLYSGEPLEWLAVLPDLPSSAPATRHAQGWTAVSSTLPTIRRPARRPHRLLAALHGPTTASDAPPPSSRPASPV